MFISFHLEPILQKVQHDARSSKTKDLVVFFLTLTKSATQQRCEHEARSANFLFLHSDGGREKSKGASTRREARKRNFFILIESTSAAKAQARGAKRETFFSSFRRMARAERRRRHEARSAKIFFFFILTEGASSEGAGTRREARKNFFGVLLFSQFAFAGWSRNASTLREARKKICWHSRL